MMTVRAGKSTPAGQGGRCKHRIENAFTHQFFDHDFPGWEMSRMMRGDAVLNDLVTERMVLDARIGHGPLINEFGDSLLLLGRQRW